MKSKFSFDEFKLNSDGMIPVITQDYKTNEVLMLAYMTKKSFEKTLETGKMTYFSRSRQELWTKGIQETVPVSLHDLQKNKKHR